MGKEDSDENDEVAMGVSSMKTGNTTVSVKSSFSSFSGTFFVYLGINGLQLGLNEGIVLRSLGGS